jgi:hypothetical protein
MPKNPTTQPRKQSTSPDKPSTPPIKPQILEKSRIFNPSDDD